MAWVDHDYIDRTWNVLSGRERIYWKGFFAWVLFSSEILKNWAGVDVFKGRIQRVIKGGEVWESCPGLKPEYKRLYNYVKAVVKNDKILVKYIRTFRPRKRTPKRCDFFGHEEIHDEEKL